MTLVLLILQFFSELNESPTITNIWHYPTGEPLDLRPGTVTWSSFVLSPTLIVNQLDQSRRGRFTTLGVTLFFFFPTFSRDDNRRKWLKCRHIWVQRLWRQLVKNSITNRILDGERWTVAESLQLQRLNVGGNKRNTSNDMLRVLGINLVFRFFLLLLLLMQVSPRWNI